MQASVNLYTTFEGIFTIFLQKRGEILL